MPEVEEQIWLGTMAIWCQFDGHLAIPYRVIDVCEITEACKPILKSNPEGSEQTWHVRMVL